MYLPKLGKIAIVLLLCFISAALAWAGGNKEVKGNEAQGLENWSDRIDLTDKEPGEYNIIIQGTDLAGNTTIAGPYNIWIDPESDVPVVSVTNPVEQMRVGTNLNIVGIAIDDDDVKRVEIALDDGTPITANGTDYWSYYLPVADIPDGRHTITVIAYDVKEIASKPVTVSFNLDKLRPVNAIKSHENGVLVRGSVTVLGTVLDANGLARLSVSADDRETYTDVQFSSTNDAEVFGFSYGIDTTRLTDGPHVYWLRSVDKTGSIGNSAFLINVDNTAPALKVLDPASNKGVNGKVAIAGFAADLVGVKSLSWEFGKEKGDFPLVPGNPFFFRVFDLSAISERNAVVVIRSSDRAGNISEIRHTIQVDRQGDLPVVDLKAPVDKALLDTAFRISGSIADDDGPARIHYQIDGGDTASLDTTEGFSVDISGLTAGNHRLSVWAEDVNGTLGPKVERAVTIKGAAPSVRITELSKGRSPLGLGGIVPDGIEAAALDSRASPAPNSPFVPGVIVLRDAKNLVSGIIRAENAVKTAEITIGSAAAKSLTLKNGASATEKAFEFTLPNDIPFGILPIKVKVTDSYGQEGIAASFLFSLNYGRINEIPAIVIGDERLSADGRISLGGGRPLIAALVGAEAASVRLEPPVPSLSVRLEGHRIIVSPSGQASEMVVNTSAIVVTTTAKHEIRSSDISFITDSGAPVVTLNSPAAGPWATGEQWAVNGILRDESGIESIEVSNDGGKSYGALPLETSLAEASSPRPGVPRELTLSLPLGGMAEGAGVFVIKVKDAAGNEGFASAPVFVDRTAPRIEIVLPSNGTESSARIPVIVRSAEAGGVATVEYRIGEAEWTAADPRPVSVFTVPSPQGVDEQLFVRVRDRAGNETTAERTLRPRTPQVPYTQAVDPKTNRPIEPPRPSVELVLPQAQEKRGGIVRAVFRVKDLTPFYPRVSIQTEGGKAQPLNIGDTAPYFVADIDLRQVRSNQASITLTFEGDQNRRQSQTIRLPVDANADKPVAAIIHQGTLNTQAANDRNPVKLDKALFVVYAKDDSSIKELRYSFDGEAERSMLTNGFAILSAENMLPGSHKLDLTPVDGDGTPGTKTTLSFVLTGSAPRIEFAKFVKGKDESAASDMNSIVITDNINLTGNLTLGSNLASMEYRVNGAEAKKINPSMKGLAGEYSIQLGNDIRWGRNELIFKATDQNGASGERRLTLFRVARIEAEALEAPGLYIDDSRISEDGSIGIAPGGILRARFVGRPVKSVSLVPEIAALKIGFAGNDLELAVLEQGISEPFVISVIDEDGDTFASRQIIVKSDTTPPELAIDTPTIGQWLRDEAQLTGNVTEDHGLLSLSYRLNDAETYLPVPFTASAGTDTPGSSSYTFDFAVSLSEEPEGVVMLDVRAEDRGGNLRELRVPLNRDVTPPAIGQITPPVDQEVNGKITVTGSVTDNGRTAGLEFSSDGIEWTPLAIDGLFSFEIDFTSYNPLPEQFFFRAKDLSGNETVISPVFLVNQELDKPVVQIQTPLEMEVMRSDFVLSGVALDDDEVVAVYYRVDYREPAAAEDQAPAATATPGASPAAGATSGRSQASPTPQPGTTAAPSPGGTISASPAPASSPAPAVPDLSTFSRIQSSGTISIPFDLLKTGDNEHFVEIIAEDINGVLSDMQRRTFRISTAEPAGIMKTPDTEKTVRGFVEVTGSASDNNGIREIFLSFDNGASFVKAEGAEDWKYVLDTRTVKDGTHSVIIRSFDSYDTEGLFTTIINVDNTNPAVTLDLPRDGLLAHGTLSLSGRVSDGIGVRSLKLVVVPADQPVGTKTDQVVMDLPVDPVIQQEVDISALSPGWYTLRLEATDRADNLGWVSRDFRIGEAKAADAVEIVYPLEGASINGLFTVSGKVTSGTLPANIAVYVDKQLVQSVEVNDGGYFSLDLGPETLTDGSHEISAQMGSPDAPGTVSPPRRFAYAAKGPWVRFDSVHNGDFVTNRPFVVGRAGWHDPEPEKDSAEYAAWKAGEDGRRIEKIQLSIDNGRTYKDLGWEPVWRYRLETQDFPDGPLYILVRAMFKNGTMATDHTMVMVDETPPMLSLLFPSEEGRFNEYIDVAGIAGDNNGLTSVRVELRKGDKAAYEVPSFIQGLYIDGHGLGATIWEAGLGLTFFDDNVKLQVGLGQSPTGERFDGWVITTKLIANIAKIPFSFIFGPDLDFLSMSFAVGAQFTYFSMSGDTFDFSGDGVMLGAAVAQWEFAKFFIREWSVLRSYSFYVEGQLWFISSDVKAGILFKPSFGMRIGLF